jgi:hypothetical protein
MNREAIGSFGRAGLGAPKLSAKAGRSAKGLCLSAVNKKGSIYSIKEVPTEVLTTGCKLPI